MKYSEIKQVVKKLHAAGWCKAIKGVPTYRKVWEREGERYAIELSVDYLLSANFHLTDILNRCEMEAERAWENRKKLREKPQGPSRLVYKFVCERCGKEHEAYENYTDIHDDGDGDNLKHICTNCGNYYKTTSQLTNRAIVYEKYYEKVAEGVKWNEDPYKL